MQVLRGFARHEFPRQGAGSIPSPFAALFAWLRFSLAGLALAALAGCTDTLDTQVTRFQSQLPPPSGQSFFILPDDPGQIGGIEFGQYADQLAGHLAKLGYTPATSADSAALIVHFGYGVDKGHQVVQANPAIDPFWGPWHGYRGWGYGPYGGWGGGRGAWGWGWYDPWFGGDLDSYTVFTSTISLKIDDRVAGKRLFEGRAEAASESNHLPYLVPNLLEAMFTGFPGNSGETVRISIAPEKKPAPAH